MTDPTDSPDAGGAPRPEDSAHPGSGAHPGRGPRPPAGVASRAGAAVTGLVAVIGVVLAVVLAQPSGTASSGSAEQTGAASSMSGTASVAATGHTTEATVGVDGMAFTPSVLDVPAGDRLVITFENTGDQYHDLVLDNGAQTGSVAPGASATLDAGLIGGDMDGWCSLPGHRQMGMTLTIHAVAAGSGSGAAAMPEQAGAPSSGHDHAGTGTGAGADTARTAPSAAELAEQAAASAPYDAELAPLEDTTEHSYTFTVTEQEDSVAPGLTRTVWTYNGTTPGPVLHGRIGDTFHIHLVNDGSMGHSIDFHAGDIAPDGPMRTIQPGESLDYTFTAERAGIWMYHCSTMPMSMHIANGMFGAVVIEPDGLPAVDRQYVLIESEVYLGSGAAADDGDATRDGTVSTGPADADRIAGLVPDIVMFNGRAFQYDAHPLTARVGQRVRMWVLDAGPNVALSFHVVGAQFDTVWTEGHLSVAGDASTDGATRGATGAQVLPLLPAQGGYVELTTREPGHYAFVNHAMSLAEKGAHGILEVSE